MENYTLGLALFDYLPVIAAGFGLFMICRYCALLANYSGAWIVVIPIIALIGGTLKASWKLVYALGGGSVLWMSDQLFFFLATSYVLLAAFGISALHAHRKQRSINAQWWLAPMIIIAVILSLAFYLKLGSDSRTWSLLLLATLSTANIVFMLTLLGHSLKRHNWVAAAAFAGNLGLTFVLVKLARLEQTAELQWIEEFLNLANNSLLVIGAWFLIRAVGRQPQTE